MTIQQMLMGNGGNVLPLEFIGIEWNAEQTTSITVSVPSGRVTGDLIVCCVATHAGQSLSVPSGYGSEYYVDSGDDAQRIVSRVSDGTETSLSFTLGSNRDVIGYCGVFRNAAIGAVGGDSTSVGSYVFPSLGGYSLSAAAAADTDPLSAPSGWITDISSSLDDSAGGGARRLQSSGLFASASWSRTLVAHAYVHIISAGDT